MGKLYFFTTAYQDALMFGRFPRGMTMLVALVLGVVFFLIGSWFFTKMKSVFADNI